MDEIKGIYGQAEGVEDNIEESLKNEKKNNNVPNLFN